MTTILVVDDSAGVRMTVQENLRRAGYTAVVAANGEEAIEMYKNQPTDAVLLDVDMPYKDGLATLKELREFDGAARVTMLTAHGFEHVVQQARALGAMDFIVKPYRATRLVDTVHKMTGNVAVAS